MKLFRTGMLSIAVFALFCSAVLAASVDVAKTEAQYGFRIESDKPVVNFEKGESVTAVVTDPERLSQTLGISGTEKGDMLTMTYQGGNTFLFSGNSQGKSYVLKIAVSTIGL